MKISLSAAKRREKSENKRENENRMIKLTRFSKTGFVLSLTLDIREVEAVKLVDLAVVVAKEGGELDHDSLLEF